MLVDVLEDFHIELRDFYVLVDCVILEMKQCTHTPIILGRLFLATMGAMLMVSCYVTCRMIV